MWHRHIDFKKYLIFYRILRLYRCNISYNKKNLARELQNESRQYNRQQSRIKRRKKFNVNFIVKTGGFLYN
ncbi:MAG TPA: hypothetical protein DEB74_04555 [Lachnospiraceae bacterium]|nr:hypothetical protein [Lachnospiraceae bacterium]